MNDEMLERIAKAVLEGDASLAVSFCEEAAREGIAPQAIVAEGLTPGARKAGELFDICQYFLPELLLSADAMGRGIEALLPSLKDAPGFGDRGTVVLGVVEGDVHEIGKDLVGAMLTAAGFRVVDLGCNVPAAGFLRAVEKESASVLALSTMMTTTLPAMRDTIEAARSLELPPEADLRIIVGGAPLSLRLAVDLGADAYAPSAAAAPSLL